MLSPVFCLQITAEEHCLTHLFSTCSRVQNMKYNKFDHTAIQRREHRTDEFYQVREID